MVGFGGELSIYSRYVFLFHIISASYFKRVEEPFFPKKKKRKKKEMKKKNLYERFIMPFCSFVWMFSSFKGFL